MGICAWGSLSLGEDRKVFYERLRSRAQEADPKRESDTEPQDIHKKPQTIQDTEQPETQADRGESDV